MEDLYREIILDHARNGRNWGIVEPNDFDHKEKNPLCGDMLRLTMQVDEQGVISRVGWEGHGCAISQASASMLGERLVGMPIEAVRQIDKQEVLDMVGLQLSINRVKCALLPLKTLIVGLVGQRRWELIEDDET
jgi:nitrogen fixation protein NifU and related proteins